MQGNQNVIDGLDGLLADATVLYQKLRHYHWNVAGREFFTLHAKFEELYTAWAESIDELAERILMIGGTPLHTMHALLQAARVREDEGIPAGSNMVGEVLTDLEILTARLEEVAELAEGAADRGTTSLLDEIRGRIEKEMWMLSAWKREERVWA